MEYFEAQQTAAAIPARRITLRARLYVPAAANGIVLFAHGSGNSQHSPRNQRAAESLHDVGLATLMVGLIPKTGDASQSDSVGALAARWFGERLRKDAGVAA